MVSVHWDNVQLVTISISNFQRDLKEHYNLNLCINISIDLFSIEKILAYVYFYIYLLVDVKVNFRKVIIIYNDLIVFDLDLKIDKDIHFVYKVKVVCINIFGIKDNHKLYYYHFIQNFVKGSNIEITISIKRN